MGNDFNRVFKMRSFPDYNATHNFIPISKLLAVSHCVCLRQVGLRREDTKSMEYFRSACLRMISEICTFVKCIVCMFSGLNTPKLQIPGRHTGVGPL